MNLKMDCDKISVLQMYFLENPQVSDIHTCYQEERGCEKLYYGHPTGGILVEEVLGR